MLANDLKYQIERMLRWESPEHWQLRDFGQLSQLIMAYTNGWIEPQDLQRFWQSSDQATPALLHTLAQFVDYEDWDDFCARNQVDVMAPAHEPNVFHQPLREIPRHWVIIIGWLAVAVSVGLGLFLYWKR